MSIGAFLPSDIGPIRAAAIEFWVNNLTSIAEQPMMQALDSSGLFNMDAWSGVVKYYGRNLVEAAKNGELHEVSGRDSEIDEVISALRQGRNPCIVGEAGVGKTALVEGLACRIAKGEVPDDVKDWVIINVDFPSLLVGRGYNKDPNGALVRLKALFEYAKKHKNVVIFIDEVHQFAAFANLCKAYLGEGEVKFVGATTLMEFNSYIAADESLAKLFTQVKLEEPGLDVSLKILKERVPGLEKRYSVKITDQALYASLVLTSRYLPTMPKPDRDVKVLESACERASRGAADNPQAKDEEVEVTDLHVRDVISSEFGIPVSVPSKAEILNIALMPRKIKSKLLGHDNAIDTICEGLKGARFELNDADKVRYTCLVAGPTGTGKTTLCKAVSDEVGNKSIIFNATQFREIKKELLAVVEASPYATVIIEDLDKAKLDVLGEIFYALHAGFMVNDRGLKVNFKNTVIIMTVSTGDKEMTSAEVKKYLAEKVSSTVLNEIKDVVVLDKISDIDGKKIALVDLIKACVMIKNKFNVKVMFGEDVINNLALNGLAERQGAVGIKRCVSKVCNEVVSNVCKGLIAPESEIELKDKDNKITFEVKLRDKEEEKTSDEDQKQVDSKDQEEEGKDQEEEGKDQEEPDAQEQQAK